MNVSSRAHLANANKGFEVGARVAVAEYLAELVKSTTPVDLSALVAELEVGLPQTKPAVLTWN